MVVKGSEEVSNPSCLHSYSYTVMIYNLIVNQGKPNHLPLCEGIDALDIGGGEVEGGGGGIGDEEGVTPVEGELSVVPWLEAPRPVHVKGDKDRSRLKASRLVKVGKQCPLLVFFSLLLKHHSADIFFFPQNQKR